MSAFRRPAVATDLALFGVALPRLIVNTAEKRLADAGAEQFVTGITAIGVGDINREVVSRSRLSSGSKARRGGWGPRR